MILNYSKIMTNINDLKEIDRTNPYQVVGAYIHTICNYPSDNFLPMLQFLCGDNQPISNLMKQNIDDRMHQNEKYKFIGKSYFKGATPDNDYTPSTPYEIEVKENPYTDIEDGYKRLFITSGGADSDRPITVRLAKDGNYYLWSDSFIAALTDIRKPESSNPWA